MFENIGSASRRRGGVAWSTPCAQNPRLSRSPDGALYFAPTRSFDAIAHSVITVK